MLDGEKGRDQERGTAKEKKWKESGKKGGNMAVKKGPRKKWGIIGGEKEEARERVEGI